MVVVGSSVNVPVAELITNALAFVPMVVVLEPLPAAPGPAGAPMYSVMFEPTTLVGLMPLPNVS